MKIIIHMPSDVEGEWKMEQKDGKVIIEPYFYTAAATTVVSYLEVEGAGGKKAKSVLLVNGRSGNFRVDTLGDKGRVVCEFDRADVKPEKKDESKSGSGVRTTNENQVVPAAADSDEGAGDS